MTMGLQSVRFRPHWNEEDPWQVIGLLHLIHDVFAENHRATRWLELGTYGGEAATLILGHPGVRRLDCVDSWPNAVALTMSRLIGPISEGRLRVTRASTLEFAKTAGEYDMVYVDADHSYDAVRADLEAFAPHIAPGGHIGGHDYHGKFPGVVAAVDEFRGNRAVQTYRDGSWLVRM